MNTHVRDNLLALGAAWTSYTPSWTASSVNPTLGNGSISGAYIQPGKLTIGRFKLTLGSTSTVGTGGYRWSLPATGTGALDDSVGTILYDDASASRYAANGYLITTTTVGAWQNTAALAAASPVVPANGDIYTGEFTYEAA